MTVSNDWPELRELYGAEPLPDLDTCDFFHVHVDERGTSVTFALETSRLPAHPKPEWTEAAYNTLRFWIEFSGVADLRVAGLLADAERAVRIEGGGDGGGTAGRLRVSVTSETRSIAFSAAASRVTQTRVYLKGSI
ncbi:immunity protein 50 of polymorphic toxin system [Streptomyces sp. 2132.2]|uniref:Imm50 family immunity protein n=1 Tax=Streptomyces TaxID=1883 RepID=UPI000C184740|nr:Imm50 family immunity protein [Streptomyces sp. 2132.2]ROQ94402.1 immunity protein 50 of polymorphic toxin system [Streptomyces sp. 2132.2]